MHRIRAPEQRHGKAGRVVDRCRVVVVGEGEPIRDARLLAASGGAPRRRSAPRQERSAPPRSGSRWRSPPGSSGRLSARWTSPPGAPPPSGQPLVLRADPGRTGADPPTSAIGARGHPLGGQGSRRIADDQRTVERLGGGDCRARPESTGAGAPAACDAMSLVGWRTVVTGGHVCKAVGESSKPATERPSGSAMPASRAATMAPAAMSSLLATIAVGLSGKREKEVGRASARLEVELRPERSGPDRRRCRGRSRIAGGRSSAAPWRRAADGP